MDRLTAAFYAGQIDAIETAGAEILDSLYVEAAPKAAMDHFEIFLSRDAHGIDNAATRVSRKSNVRLLPTFAGGRLSVVENFRWCLIHLVCHRMITFATYLEVRKVSEFWLALSAEMWEASFEAFGAIEKGGLWRD